MVEKSICRFNNTLFVILEHQTNYIELQISKEPVMIQVNNVAVRHRELKCPMDAPA